MPYGGNDWLGLTQEEVLEPELPICDPHHHLWDQRPERIPYQRYLLPELLADVNQGHNVRSTVFIETRVMYRRSGPVEMRPVGQVEFVQGQAAMAASGIYGPTLACAAIVGYADLKLGDRVKPVLEALQAASPNRFRGVRHSVMWDPHPDFDSREPEGTMSTDTYRAGARVLAQMGHSLDAQVVFTQLPELAEFARAVPDLTIVLNHLGGLWRIGPFAGRDDEVLPAWRKGLAEVAACPNVYMKLGALGSKRAGFGWHERDRPPSSQELASAWRPYVETCIEAFGPARCMFESNFPVDKASCSYVVLWNGFKRIAAGASPEEKADLFRGTARRFYRIE